MASTKTGFNSRGAQRGELVFAEFGGGERRAGAPARSWWKAWSGHKARRSGWRPRRPRPSSRPLPSMSRVMPPQPGGHRQGDKGGQQHRDAGRTGFVRQHRQGKSRRRRHTSRKARNCFSRQHPGAGPGQERQCLGRESQNQEGQRETSRPRPRKTSIDPRHALRQGIAKRRRHERRGAGRGHRHRPCTPVKKPPPPPEREVRLSPSVTEPNSNRPERLKPGPRRSRARTPPPRWDSCNWKPQPRLPAALAQQRDHQPESQEAQHCAGGIGQAFLAGLAAAAAIRGQRYALHRQGSATSRKACRVPGSAPADKGEGHRQPQSDLRAAWRSPAAIGHSPNRRIHIQRLHRMVGGCQHQHAGEIARELCLISGVLVGRRQLQLQPRPW